MSDFEFYNKEYLEADKSLQKELSPNFELNSYPIEYGKNIINQFDQETKTQEINEGIQQVLDEAQNKEVIYIENAKILIENGEYQLAHNLIREVLTQNPRSQLAIKYMGQALMGLNRVDEAISFFKTLVDVNEGFVTLAMLAEAYYSSGNDDEALEFYLKSLENLDFESPILFEVYKNLGNIYVRAGELGLAEHNYNRAYLINPESDSLLVNYGTLEIQRLNWDIALSHFRKAAKINPENDKAWVGLALIHREYGDHVLSWANLHRALDLNPTNSLSLQLAIDWGLKDGKEGVVISRLQDFLVSENQNVEMSYLLAQLLFRVERYKYCLQELERTVLIDPLHQRARDLKTLAQKELNVKAKGKSFDR